jgi:hypothetical protein
MTSEIIGNIGIPSQAAHPRKREEVRRKREKGITNYQ